MLCNDAKKDDSLTIYIYIEDSKKVDEKQNIGGAYSRYRVVGYQKSFKNSIWV